MSKRIESDILAPNDANIEVSGLDTLPNSFADRYGQEIHGRVDSIPTRGKKDGVESSDQNNRVTLSANNTIENEVSKSSESLSAEPPAQKVQTRVTVSDWELKDRKAVSLATPAAVPGSKGIVKILIKVDIKGKVVFAEVDPASSSVNVKLKEKAREAAKKSVFNQSSNAAPIQDGTILYEFL
ncbi:MAG: hypothetical protein IJL22_00730 [Bacteroidales bacterium]|nr:hypothetical protein [Bacteroidales bacterium]